MADATGPHVPPGAGRGPSGSGAPVRVAVIVFPGTNCERDTVDALCRLGAVAEPVWHRVGDLDDFDAAVLPGGFAHGDYLRPGAIARFSPVMDAVGRLAERGRPVVGICNGFQILCEAGLLPGALHRNSGLKFVCRTVPVRVGSTPTVLTTGVAPGRILRLPVNHFTGSWVCPPDELEMLEEAGRIVLRYVENPNGSVADAAAVCDPTGTVVGLMPHPERAHHRLLGGTDGNALLEALIASARTAREGSSA